ncbi:MAG: hypothetical protein Q8L81_04155 [Bacteroidota bacterium]|nr:hypothetical protein [Bacteroidota bacterium]
MSFTGREDHHVTLEEATAWTANYRNNNPGEVRSHFYGRDAISAILAQTNCVGIRIYHAINDRDEKVLVLVGVKSDESDMHTGLMAERGIMCPPMCSPDSPLNGE